MVAVNDSQEETAAATAHISEFVSYGASNWEACAFLNIRKPLPLPWSVVRKGKWAEAVPMPPTPTVEWNSTANQVEVGFNRLQSA